MSVVRELRAGMSLIVFQTDPRQHDRIYDRILIGSLLYSWLGANLSDQNPFDLDSLFQLILN